MRWGHRTSTDLDMWINEEHRKQKDWRKVVEHLEANCPNWEWQLDSAKEICIAKGCLDQDMVKVQGIDITLFKPESSEKGRNAILGLRTEDYVTRVEDTGITQQSVEECCGGRSSRGWWTGNGHHHETWSTSHTPGARTPNESMRSSRS